MKKYSRETSVGIFVLVGLLGIAYMSIKLGNLALFTDNYITLKASFTNVSGLKINSPVQMYGVDVGYVEAIDLDLSGDIPLANVRMKIRKGLDIRDDATASVKTSGLIGDKFIGLTAGAVGKPVADGSVIFQTNPSLDLEELLAKFATPSVNK